MDLEASKRPIVRYNASMRYNADPAAWPCQQRSYKAGACRLLLKTALTIRSIVLNGNFLGVIGLLIYFTVAGEEALRQLQESTQWNVLKRFG